jgi:nuclear pore complex protein Nup205
MAARNDPNVERFVGSIKLAWVIHLILIQDAHTERDTISSASSSDLAYLQSCLELIFPKNDCHASLS